MDDLHTRKTPRIPILLRKSRAEEGPAVVLKKDDFPFSFIVDGKRYVTRMTKKGGVQTTTE